jgi:protein-tyrosine phosphatase
VHVTDDVVGDDRAAVVCAVFCVQTDAGKLVTDRMSRDEQPAVTPELLAAMRAEWEAAGRPIVQPHAHRDAVTFADGSTVVGVRFLVDDPYKRDQPPTFGLYLDSRWAPPWEHAHLPWVDFGVPDASELRVALEDVLDRARRGEHVEIGCLGGHGRTGTALACLAVLTGTPPEDAVAWVRAAYCAKAVETDEQRAFVAAFSQAL